MNSHLIPLVGKLAKSKILVIGDIIIDHFIWGNVSRISPEAPVPVVNVNREEFLLGGGANVLHNIYSLGGNAVLCGIVGNDEMGERLRQLLAQLGASDEGLVQGKRPTTVKTRVVAQGQQVVRFDREQTGRPAEITVAWMRDYIVETLSDFDAVIVSDYYKGVISLPLMQVLLSEVKRIEEQTGKIIPVVVDPKPAEPERFSGATIITPNHLEAEKMSGCTINSREELLQAAGKLQEKLACDAILITRGEAGMALLVSGKELITIPTMAKEVFDVTGAGDTVIAALALGLACGADYTDAATLANVAAGIVVGKVGTATVEAAELLEALTAEQ